MDLKLPEETLMKLGFRLLDIIYGKLTIKKGYVWNEVFVDKDRNSKLGYGKKGLDIPNILGYLYDDREFFLSIIPVERDNFEWVLGLWVEEHYKRRVDITSFVLFVE